MAVQYVTADVWVLVDQDGNYAAVEDGGDVRERYAEQVQPVEEADGLRLVKVSVRVPLCPRLSSWRVRWCATSRRRGCRWWAERPPLLPRGS
jgi:hypothetical protein